MLNFRSLGFLLATLICIFLAACTANQQATAIPATPAIIDEATATTVVATVIIPTATAETAPVQPTDTAVPTPIPEPIRVQFAPGTTSALLTGVVANGQVDRYLLGALAGQELTAYFTNEDINKVNIGIEAAGQVIVSPQPNVTIVLPGDRDYIVSVYGLDSTPFTYELTVAISALVTSPPLENLDYAARTSWISFLGVPAECGTGTPVDIQFQQQNGSGMTIHQFGSDKYIIQLVCDVFAYSTHSRLFFFDAVGNSTVALPVPEFDPTTNAIVNFDFLWGSDLTVAATTQTLTNFQKGRGVGDCGALNTYDFVSDHLVLTEARHRSCDSVEEPVMPSEWPIVYPVE